MAEEGEADDMNIDINAEEDAMINGMVIVAHLGASSPDNMMEDISDVEMQNAYPSTEANYTTNSVYNHHSHENNNNCSNIGSIDAIFI